MSIDLKDQPAEDRIKAEVEAAIAAGAQTVVVALHAADRGRCGPKIIETDYHFFDETKLWRDTPAGDYQLIVRADGVVKTRIPWNVRKPADALPVPLEPPPMPAPSPASLAGGQVTTQPVGLVELLIAQMNNTAAVQTAQINAQSQLMGQLFASLAGTMKERTAERTPLDELIKLHKLVNFADVDKAEPTRPLLDPDTAAALVGVLSKFAERPAPPPRVVRVPAPSLPAPPRPAVAADVVKPAAPAADVGDLDNDEKLGLKSAAERALPVVVAYLELAFSNPDAVDEEIAATLADLMGDAGFPADEALEQTEPGILSTMFCRMNPHLDAGRVRQVESAMRAQMETNADGSSEPEQLAPLAATADDDAGAV